MRFQRTIIFVLALACVASIGAAAEPGNPAAEIAPFVNEQTLAAGQVDLTRIDFDAAGRWVDDVLAQSNLPEDDRRSISPQLHRGILEAKQWADRFKQAGGRTIWIVFTLETFPRSAPVLFVVPLGPNADADALKKLFGGGGGGGAAAPNAAGGEQAQSIARVHDALVGTPDVAGLDVIKALRAKERPELAKALAEAGDAPLGIAFIPTSDARRVIESMAPPLPDGQSITALTRGVVWAAAGVRFPPDASGRAVIQSESHAAAQAMQDLLKSVLRASRERNPAMPSDPLAAKLLGPAAMAAMVMADRSRVEVDRVVVDLDAKNLGAVVAGLGTAAHVARERASRVVTSNRERQLLLACITYAEEHKTSEFPDTLEQAVKAANVTAVDLMINPRHPERKPGFVYIKPPEGIKAPPDRLVLYEAFDAFDGGISVGFADSHVEWVGDEASFNKMLRTARDAK